MHADSSSKRVTLHDVADLAGVSYQTVSRVINNNPHVSKATRQRVAQAIKTLDYRPNYAARSLVTRRSNLLEIISFGARHYGPTQMVTHIEEAARKLGYNLILSHISEMTLSAISGAVDNLSGRLVDGMILITPVIGVAYEEIVGITRGIPFVMIDTPLGTMAPGVVINQHFGGQLAARHLIDLGHSRICEISGPLDWFGAIARHESWLSTLSAAGLEPTLSVQGDWTPIGGYEAARKLLAQDRSFTGLVVGNDQMALGAMRALREGGLRVPDDVSVVGFDDIPEAVCFEPPLTTIRQDFEALGTQSVEYLVELINRPDQPIQQQILYPTLIARQSTRAIT